MNYDIGFENRMDVRFSRTLNNNNKCLHKCVHTLELNVIAEDLISSSSSLLHRNAIENFDDIEKIFLWEDPTMCVERLNFFRT